MFSLFNCWKPNEVWCWFQSALHKIHKTDLCISNVGNSTKWKLLSAESLSLHLPGNWFIVSLRWQQAAQLFFSPLCRRAVAQAPSCRRLRWAVLLQHHVLGWINSHLLHKTIVSHKQTMPGTSEVSFNLTDQAQEVGLHLVLITLDYQEVFLCVSPVCKSPSSDK